MKKDTTHTTKPETTQKQRRAIRTRTGLKGGMLGGIGKKIRRVSLVDTDFIMG